MNINNPTTFGVPNLSLSTSNSSGTGGALRSDDTILVFDAADPAAVAASAVVGSATVTARRDHVHPGIVGAGTVVDEAITRFNGTGGASLQGYSSLSPTISDAGIVTLTSGALKFPATEIASTDANTLDDYEEGTFTAQIADDSGSGTGEGQSYVRQTGFYTRIGRLCFFNLDLITDSIGSLTTSQQAKILGLPFTINNATGNNPPAYVIGSALALTTASESVVTTLLANTTTMRLEVWDATAGTSAMTIAEWSADGAMRVAGVYMVA